ncbi:DUF3810 domain-containing protein [Seonamhaeicola sp. ML3]|uniref:DUF3810 domain-containing protein n=1 Tax=Seonamhaeicola sp. ML3 TaxID=2937786 RepID=UPI00200DF5AA|nr:DUF3810 domain-containing protein [Seonamhaeicola sp. ML3]
MLKNKKLLLALSLIPQYVLVVLLSKNPEFIESFYSNGIYVYVSKLFRFMLGWLPFSFGDLVYGLAIIYIMRWLIIHRKRIIKDTINWLVDIVAAAAILYFTFHLFWGLNYYRLPLHESLNLDHKYTTEQLVATTNKLIEHTNTLHAKIKQNDTVKVTLPYSKSEIFKKTPEGYDNLKAIFPHLEYAPKSIKKSLFSYPLTYMGFSGYLNPLTNESQVNGVMPLIKIPTTTAHEMAHQLGYAAENEANFLGFLASIHNDDIYFKYCGYTFGLRYCLNEIYRRDEALFKEIIKTINKGVLKNYEEVRLFWEAQENPIEPFFKIFYGSYLKANNQSKGMNSYNYVVALLVNYIETNGLD